MKISEERFETSVIWFTGASIAAVLVFSLFAIHFNQNEQMGLLRTFLFFTFFSLSISRIPSIIYSKKESSKIGFIKNICFSGIYFALAFVAALISKQYVAHRIIGTGYLLTVLANRVLIMIQKKKISAYVINAFLAFIVVILILSGLLMDNTLITGAYLVVVLFLIIVFSLIEVLTFAFSRIQLKSLLKIMRKTFVFEILYGLIILMVTFSFYFYIMEENITSFGEGLWYSFAIVSTIGFGDFTVTAPISRILSVILGIYGIIVVAAITSVIVNFYNEVKTKDDDKPETKEKEDDSKDNKE